MNCPQCRHENAAGNRFCGMCGTRLHAAEVKPDPAAPTVTWLKGMEERRPMDAASRAEAERAQREREMAERAERAAARERELAIRAEAERAAIREHERQRATSVAAPREQATRRPAAVAGPSFLGLNESYDSGPDERKEEYEGSDIYGGQRSYSRALWLLVLLLVVSGLLFLQYRYSHSLRASQPREKPSAAEPGTANPVNPEAKQEDELAKQNQDTTAKPAEAGSEAKAEGDDNSGQTSAEDKAKLEKQAELARGDKDSSAGSAAAKPASKSKAKQKAAATDDSTEPQNDEAAAAGAQPTSKPTAKTRAASIAAIPEASDAPVQQADLYLRGRGVPRNCDQGVGILRSAANRGNYKADIKLGALYATGNCVSLDRVQAYRFFSRALQAKPNNTWVEQNRSMLWAQMNEQERQQAMEHSF